MQKYNIRALEPSDSKQLCKLLKTRDNIDEKGAEARTRLQEWVAFNNPYRENGETTYYIVENNGDLIAFHGRMPVQFILNGEKVKGYYVHDLYVHPDYRKQGQGFWLTMSLAKAIEKDSSGPFCLLGMTALNLEMQRRRGYFETQVDGYHKIINPYKQIKRIFKNKIIAKMINLPVKACLALIDVMLTWIFRSGIEVITIDRFDDRFDELFTKVKSKTGISTCRESTYLNWKYVDRPYKREVILAAKKDHRITGFMVISMSPYRETYTRGIIVDLLVDPDEIKSYRALLISAISYFRQKQVYSINCLLSDPLYIREFKKFLFFKKIGKKMLLGNYQSLPEYKSIDNWHMTLGESDAFMLSR